MNPTLIGAIKSKTVYLGLAVVVLGYLGNNPAGLEPVGIPAGLIQNVVNVGNYVVGLLVIAARFVTEGSLADKVE